MDFKDKETLQDIYESCEISIPIGHFATFAQGKAAMRGHEELLWEKKHSNKWSQGGQMPVPRNEFLGVFL